MNKEEILIQDYTYSLPADRIAHHPLSNRHDSKLLVYKSGRLTEDSFHGLPQHLPEEALLVLNDTRVIEARLFFTKPTGGIIEIFCLEPANQSMELSLQEGGSAEWKCLVGGASKWKPGQVLQKELFIEGQSVVLEVRYKGKVADAFLLLFSWAPSSITFAQILGAAGHMPLPPYIKRSTETGDSERYQTIFARQKGSVAAPTAALHFTPTVFESLRQKGISTSYITLNVGAGTFKPVKTASVADHPMHSETFSVTQQTLAALLKATTLVAVGTTSLRTLESLYWLGVKLLHNGYVNEWALAQWEAYALPTAVPYQESLRALLQWMEENQQATVQCRTALLIAPGYRFQLPAALITNFHQPQSTLLLLVAAFIGADWKKVYQHALDNDYRFLSYGDSSLLWKNENANE